MLKKHARGSIQPLVITIPGDAILAVTRAGELLQDAGDLHGTIALYENFIKTLRECELTPIENLEWHVPVPDPAHPGKNVLEFSMVRSHPSQYSLA